MMIGSRQTNSQASSSEHSCKYQFDLELHHMEGGFPRECSLEIIWKRGPNSISTQNPIKALPTTPHVQINEKLSFVSTCTMKQGYFVPKASQIAILLNQNNIPKKIGKYNLQLTSILNPTQYNTNTSKQFAIQIQNCLLKEGIKLYFKLSSQYFSESQIPRAPPSQCSNVEQQGFMKALNEHCQMKASNGSSNMLNTTNVLGTTKGSSGVGGQAGMSGSISSELKMSNFLEKRDLMSVGSYASSMRRADSLQKEACGREYGLLSSKKIQLSAKRDNRTENGDCSFAHKQLNDEQNKRSRLEAQINKNKMYIEELKKKLNQMLAAQSKTNDQKKKIQEENYCLRKDIETIKSNKQQIQKYQIELGVLRNQNCMYKDQNMRMLKEIELSNKENKNTNSELNYQIKRITDQYNAQTNKYAQLNIKYMEMQKQCEQYKYESRSNNILITNLNEQMKKNREQSARMKEQAFNAKDEHNRVREQLQKHYKEIQQCKDESNKLRQQLFKALQQSSRSKDELSRVKSQFNTKSNEQILLKTNQIHSIEQELTQSNAKMHSLEEELSESKSSWQRSQEQNKVLRESNRVCVERQSCLKQECTLLRQEMGTCKQELNGLRQEVSKQKGESIQQRQENAQLRQDNLQVRQELSALRNEVTPKKEKRVREEEADRLMRESVQLQVELKYANEEISRLQSIKSEVDELRWKLALELKNREDMEHGCERVERELAIKARQLMIEGEKNKMLTEQLNEAHSTIGEMQQQIAFASPKQKEGELRQKYEKEGAEKNKVIEEMRRSLEEKNKEMYKLKRQINDAEQYAIACKEKNDLLIAKCNDEIEQRKSEGEQYRERLQEKDIQVQDCKRDACNYKRDIESYESEIRGYKMEIQQYRQEIESMSEKMNSSNGGGSGGGGGGSGGGGGKEKHDGENQKLHKRIEMMMEEMHLMKKKYEESKPVLRQDETIKMKQLENELEKRDKIISKMSKEKLELDQQNVKMTVQIMKLISEVDRYKKAQK